MAVGRYWWQLGYHARARGVQSCGEGVEAVAAVDLSISELSEDDFFGDDDLFGDISDDDSILGSNSDFDSILGDTSLRDELNQTDDGAWQFVLAKLENPKADKKLVAELNKRFKEEGINAQAMDWKKAAYS